MANVTYSHLGLGKVTVGGGGVNEKEPKIARLRIVSDLITPSVQKLTLYGGCRIENIDLIEACTTVTQIELCAYDVPAEFSPVAIQRLLQTIAKRNRELARFVANPGAHPHNELLTLMSQFDSVPPGRYMLARCFPEIPLFLRSIPALTQLRRDRKKSTDSTLLGPLGFVAS